MYGDGNDKCTNKEDRERTAEEKKKHTTERDVV